MALQVYREDGSMVIHIVGSPYFGDRSVEVSAEDVENLERIEREYHKENPPMTFRPFEVAELFPEGKEYLNARKKEIHERLGLLQDMDRKINERFSAFKDKPVREQMLMQNQWEREDLLIEEKQNDEILSFMPRSKKATALKAYAQELARAKAYPIDKLLAFKHNKALCLWHTDRNPSLYYYRKQNRVYCFACNQGGDAVDVTMKIRNCSHNDAIAFLNQ